MALVVYNHNQQNLLSSSVNNGTASYNKTKNSEHYVGLSNQGATCYLNSLLQTLYMTPEFRHAIFSWRYDKTKSVDEHLCIPLQLQRLFGMLSLAKESLDEDWVDTIALTKSFGWDSNEVFQQQVTNTVSSSINMYSTYPYTVVCSYVHPISYTRSYYTNIIPITHLHTCMHACIHRMYRNWLACF